MFTVWGDRTRKIQRLSYSHHSLHCGRSATQTPAMCFSFLSTSLFSKGVHQLLPVHVPVRALEAVCKFSNACYKNLHLSFEVITLWNDLRGGSPDRERSKNFSVDKDQLFINSLYQPIYCLIYINLFFFFAATATRKCSHVAESSSPSTSSWTGVTVPLLCLFPLGAKSSQDPMPP